MLFLKLGGSLITEKDKPSMVRADTLARVSKEIATARAADPGMRLLLGHGSGSFGHFPAQQHGTRRGVASPEQWRGFTEVWRQAAALNHLVMDALHAAGLPAVAFPPSASVLAADGTILAWDLQPIRGALEAGLLPVVFGDVAFDTVRGGTILSTEDLFVHSALNLKPARILLTGDEEGVLANYLSNPQLIREITPASYSQIIANLSGPAVPDVTGGMVGKVEAMLGLIDQLADCQVRIFSGLVPGNIQKAISGASLGTLLKHD
ncbi:MAG: isopentenyl phosphate kinase [Anaerolineales bacterium]